MNLSINVIFSGCLLAVISRRSQMIQTEVSVIPLPDEEDRSESESPETEEQPEKRASVEVCR